MALDKVYEVVNSDTKKRKRIGVEMLPGFNGEEKYLKIRAMDLKDLLEIASGTDGQYGCLGSTYDIQTKGLSDDEFNAEMDRVQKELELLLK